MVKKDLFKELPPTFILAAHYEPEELAILRKNLESHACTVTTSIFHAELVITKLTQEKRIQREIHDLIRNARENSSPTKEMAVVKERWIRKCLQEGKLVDYPFTDTTWRTFQFAAIHPITPPKRGRSPQKFAVPGEPASKRRTLSQSGNISEPNRPPAVSGASFEYASSDDPTSRHYHPDSQTSTNSSDDEADSKFGFRDVYACRRQTPLISRNEGFIKLLVEIKLARELALYIPRSILTKFRDKIGVRAYASAIAALKAYPHKLTTSTNISKLPGCGPKIASIYKDYVRTGTIAECTHLQNSSEFQTLKLFWGVWGCGAHTARNWYFGKGWRSLDDVIEQGWDTISRVQQIGIKYWEEFNEQKITRSEVEEIGRIVGEASQEVAHGTVYEICGGYPVSPSSSNGRYRRGKSASGDVDIILSNPRPHATQNFCVGLVRVLEEKGIITHTLTISTATSDREENPKISLRTKGPLGTEHGFGLDSLDKALVVFLLPKDNSFYTGIHRRVDLIIAPWRAWGTAIVGWTVDGL